MQQSDIHFSHRSRLHQFIQAVDRVWIIMPNNNVIINSWAKGE